MIKTKFTQRVENHRTIPLKIDPTSMEKIEKVVEIESTLTPKEKKERVELCEKYGEKAEQLRQSHKLRAQQKCPDCRKNSDNLAVTIVKAGTGVAAGQGEKNLVHPLMTICTINAYLHCIFVFKQKCKKKREGVRKTERNLRVFRFQIFQKHFFACRHYFLLDRYYIQFQKYIYILTL